MTFNVNQFKNQLTYGGARPALFQVQLSLPALADPVNNGITDATAIPAPVVERKVAFLANATSLPTSKVRHWMSDTLDVKLRLLAQEPSSLGKLP